MGDVSNTGVGKSRTTVAADMRRIIYDAALGAGLVGGLGRLYRQCERESSWEPDACNLCHGPCRQAGDAEHHRRSCYGPFQLSAATAAELGVNRDDMEANIRGGVRYMAQLLKRYRGNWARSLCAYNWGMGNLAKCQEQHGAEWQSHVPAETQAYVAFILGGLNV